MKQEIDALKDENYLVEHSMAKSFEANVTYGTKDSIRVDQDTVCIYDIKTGSARLSFSRIGEIASTARKAFPETSRLVLIEVRPRT